MQGMRNGTMSDEGHRDGVDDVLRLAMHAEGLQFSSLGWLQLHPAQDSDSALQDALSAYAATMWGAALGAAKRIAQKHAGATPSPHLRELMRAAEIVEEELPPTLRELWQAHYVDGYDLGACVRSGSSAEVTRSDYIEIIRFLMGEVRSRATDPRAVAMEPDGGRRA
jgi:hypothetical protein